MNTNNLNKFSQGSETFSSSTQSAKQEGVTQSVPQAHITSSAAIEMPRKKGKKAKGAFRTISEVAKKLDVQQHVLRFWETKFSQVRPLKRGGGRRYYRPEDVALLQRIHYLLYTDGYTIKGVQKLLKGQGKAQIIAQGNEANNENASSSAVAASPKVAPSVETKRAPSSSSMSVQQRTALEIMLAELKAMRDMIKA